MREFNPITKKIQGLIESGLSREKICVHADITFYSLRQIFLRNRVSKFTMLSFLKSNLITEEDKHDYEKWLRSEKGPETKRKKRAPGTKGNNQPEAELSKSK